MYKFRVRAVNRQGESEPLESERAIVAKNPFGKLIFLCGNVIVLCTISETLNFFMDIQDDHK